MTDDEADAILERVNKLEGEFEPGRWWQVTYAGGLWIETSREDEARRALAKCPSPGVLQRMYERTQREWRDVPD
jgi:hypothetical protein